MIAHCFLSRGDDWILRYHLAAYSRFCDVIVAVLDRSPRSEAICREFPKVETIHWTPTQAFSADFDDTGLLCDEGAMRQAGFDACAKHDPEFVVFGDTDETPTPDIVDFLAAGPDSTVDLWYADWVNLVYSTRTAIGGQRSRWSFQRSDTNKKGLILRYQSGRQYVYRRGLQHVRMEPSPLHEGKTVFDDTHRLLAPKLVHYKYAAWDRWQANPQSQTPAYRDLLDGAEIVAAPSQWHWPFPIPELQP